MIMTDELSAWPVDTIVAMTSSAEGTDDPSDDEVEPGGAPDSVPQGDPLIIGSVYQGLVARYNSLTTIRWQTLALGLTAQGFVVGAASQVEKAQLATAIMLAVVILFIGLATIVTGQRFELVALADRHMLEKSCTSDHGPPPCARLRG